MHDFEQKETSECQSSNPKSCTCNNNRIIILEIAARIAGQTWKAMFEGRTHIFQFLPPYSPFLNPKENYYVREFIPYVEVLTK